MPLQLVSPVDRFKFKPGYMSDAAVLGHMESVLKTFAAKPEYSRFYIGITNDLRRRLKEHRADPDKKDFKLMFPIVEEESKAALGGSFDGLELAAIERFNPGVPNPVAKTQLKCTNDKRGLAAKCVMYILVG